MLRQSVWKGVDREMGSEEVEAEEEKLSLGVKGKKKSGFYTSPLPLTNQASCLSFLVNHTNSLDKTKCKSKKFLMAPPNRNISFV